MNVNSLGGARMPVTTATDRTSQTAATRFGSLVQGSASPATSGRSGLTGSNVIASAISASSGGVPGFGGPYLQAAPSAGPSAGAPATTATPGQTPPAAGSEFNAELSAMFEQQNQLKEIMKMSLTSFVNSTFSMGQNRPKAEEW